MTTLVKTFSLKAHRPSKGIVFLMLWGVLSLSFLGGSLFLVFWSIEKKESFESEEKSLTQALLKAEGYKKTIEALMAREDLTRSYELLHQPFQRALIEKWAQKFANSHDCHITLNPQTKPASPYALGEKYSARTVIFSLKTHVDHTFFDFIKALLFEAPVYCVLSNSTLKRLQPMSDDVLIRLRQGDTSYFFEGTVCVEVVSRVDSD